MVKLSLVSRRRLFVCIVWKLRGVVERTGVPQTELASLQSARAAHNAGIASMSDRINHNSFRIILKWFIMQKKSYIIK